MAAAAAAEALAKVNQLEKTFESKIQEAQIAAVTIQKRDFLESQCKQFENNIKVSGLVYDIKVYYKKNATQRREWRGEMARYAFIDTKVLAEDVLFATSANGKKELKRIVRDAHPLGKTNNSTVIFAFTESWLANEIKERVRKAEGLELTKMKRNRESAVVKINSHLPVIIECLKNEGLRSRKSLIAASNGQRKIVLNESLKHPWISLFEINGDTKTPLPFQVEDCRLTNLPRTLAILSIQGSHEFKPFRFLSEDEKKDIATYMHVDTFNPVLPMITV